MTPPRLSTVQLLAFASAMSAIPGVEAQARIAEETHLDRLRRAAREAGYRFEGDGADLRCVPVLAQTSGQADAAKARAEEKRKRKAAKRLAAR